jgi:hypothetical protein
LRRRLAPGRLPLIKWEPRAPIGVHSPRLSSRSQCRGFSLQPRVQHRTLR